MPELPIVSPGEIIASAHINKLAERTVQRYADVTERDLLNPTPTTGELSYLEDSGTLDIFNGTDWRLTATTLSVNAIEAFPGVNLIIRAGPGDIIVFYEISSDTWRVRKDMFIESQLEVHASGAGRSFIVHPALSYFDASITDFRLQGINSFPTTSASPNLNWATSSQDGRAKLSTSSRRFKENIEPIDLTAMPLPDPMAWNDINGDGTGYVGTIAEDWADLDARFGVYNDDGDVMNYHDRAAMAVLSAHVKALEARVAALES